MTRVEHVLFGIGTVIAPRTTESGRPALLVRFDGSEIDRLILADFLKPSKAPALDLAPVKKTRRRKTVSSPVEVISDQLRGEETEAVEA